MFESKVCGFAASGGSLDVTLLYQEWFVDLLNGSGIFSHRRGNGV
jgi:hypothetical protein